MIYIIYFSIRVIKIEGIGVEVYFWLYCEFEVSFSYVRYCVKKENIINIGNSKGRYFSEGFKN